jgi:hypothetical protein
VELLRRQQEFIRSALATEGVSFVEYSAEHGQYFDVEYLMRLEDEFCLPQGVTISPAVMVQGRVILRGRVAAQEKDTIVQRRLNK